MTGRILGLSYIWMDELKTTGKPAKIAWSQLACLVLCWFCVKTQPGWCNTTPTKNTQQLMQLSVVAFCSLLPQLKVSLASITSKLQNLHEISWFAWLIGLVWFGFAVCKSTSPLIEFVLFDSLPGQERNWAALPHELFQDKSPIGSIYITVLQKYIFCRL